MNDFIYSDEMIRVAFSGGPVDTLLKDAPDTVHNLSNHLQP